MTDEHDEKTVCEKCSREISVDEVQMCDECGVDGLGECCIGPWDHGCTPEPPRTPMHLKLDCDCGNPDCKQSAFIRKGAVFHGGSDDATHWNQGYVSVHGFDGVGPPVVMLEPRKMVKLRDWLNEMYRPTSAPDLLEAVEGLLANASMGDSPWVDKAVAAVTKARAEERGE